MASAGPEDIDGSGRVDILDAFALAKQIKSGRQLDSRWDINSDGGIDDRDVDAVALAAVSLEEANHDKL